MVRSDLSVVYLEWLCRFRQPQMMQKCEIWRRIFYENNYTLCPDKEIHSVDMIMMMMMMIICHESEGIENLVRKMEDYDSNFGILWIK